ncbi:MAG: histidine kinase dimerization/phospho-acceptor domain-containing protein, partial [bacterium]
MMAHEVRNPLQSLALLCALARIEPDAARRGELLAKIEGEILHLEAVVQRILRSSGPLQVRREPADLVDVVQAAVVIAEAEARARRV